MKRIVTGIDFSKTSVLAFCYAMNIARRTESDLLLLNVQKHLDYEVPHAADDRKGPESVHQQFEELVSKHQSDFPGRIEHAVREGKVSEEIANQARYSDAWLVVVGAHGLSGFEEFWMGTHSYRVVSTCVTPVITVRLGYDVNREIKNVVIPIDNTLETTQKVPLTLDLAKRFGANIHLLSLFSDSTQGLKEKVETNTRQAKGMITQSGLDMHEESLMSENITKTTIEYAKKVDADLISIMTEQEYAPLNIFLGPYAQQMVNQSPIPVLSMHTKTLIRSKHVM